MIGLKKFMSLLTALLLICVLLVPAVGLAEPAPEATVEATAAAEAGETAAPEAEVSVEEAAEEEKEGLFDELMGLPWYTIAVIIALIAAGVIFILASKRVKWDSRRIAIAFVLSCIRLYRMLQGGSITPASMMPLVLFMVACGPLQGFVVGCAYGLLQLITDPYVIHPIQLLVDYPLAYGAMALGCLATLLPVRKEVQLPVAVILAGLGRYVMAVLSGAIFFAESAGEQNALIYSLGYNISYLGPDTIVCMLVACIPGMARLITIINKKHA